MIALHTSLSFCRINMRKYILLLAIFISAYKSPDGIKYLNSFSQDVSTKIPTDDVEDVSLNAVSEIIIAIIFQFSDC